MKALALLFVPLLAMAEGANPKAVVENIFSKTSEPQIVSDPAKQAEVNKMVDFNALAQAALGANAKKVAPKDYEWFRNTLQEIITRTVYPKAPDFLKGVKISYTGVEQEGNKAEVHSTVQNKADLTDVDYNLQKQSDGSWRVSDITLSGSRWSEVIHDEITDVLRKKKWTGLRAAMNKRLSELKHPQE